MEGKAEKTNDTRGEVVKACLLRPPSALFGGPVSVCVLHPHHVRLHVTDCIEGKIRWF